MKVGWEIKKLGEVCEFQGGSQPPKSQFIYEPKEGYVRFLQIRDFASDKNITYIPESKKNRYCNEDDILLGRYGASVGKVLVNKAGAYNVAVMKTIPDETVLSKPFLFLYLSSDDFQNSLANVAARSAQNGFSKKDIFDFPFALPPLPEQQRIVSILDKAFAAIDKAKANAEQNLQNTKELFESYLQGVFEKKGDGWVQTILADIFDVKHGFAFQGKYFSNNGEYVLLTPGNFYEEGGYRDRGEKQKYYNGEIPSDFILKKGDLLVAMTEQAAGLLGSPIIVPESNKFLHNQRLGLIIPKPNVEIDNEFFYHVFNLKKVRQALHDSGTGVKVRHTSPKKIGQVEISYPKTKKEQQAIVHKLDALRAETQKLEAVYQKKVDDLEELKKSILQKAFAGELKTSASADKATYKTDDNLSLAAESTPLRYK